MIGLDSPVVTVLGDTPAAKLTRIEKKLGLRTVGDLLEHFPRRYLPMGELSEVGRLVDGMQLTVVGRIQTSETISYTDRRTGRPAYRVEAVVATNGPWLRMTFFAKNKNVAAWHARRVPEGRQGVFIGKVGSFRGEWQLTNPTIVMFGQGEDAEPQDRAALAGLSGMFPIYPRTEGVQSWDLHRAIGFALSVVDDYADPLPEDLRARHGLPDRSTALRRIHAPASYRQAQEGLRHYRFAEALVTQLVLARRRASVRAEGARPRAGRAEGLLSAFDARLPFALTEGQREVSEEIFTDLAQPHPMSRLLQGEVGSGKTVVALRAMLRVIDSDGQAALLAPTEVLAQQHFRSIVDLLGDLAAGGLLGGVSEATTVALLTGSMSKAARAEAMLRIASGEAGIVIGTHALLEDRVTFADLGLVVVDEQHRFGVEQRAALTDKATSPPHLLVMTATPIPRTVAMTVFGDLEVSTLRELPAGRAPIQTTVVPAGQAHWMDRVWARVREEVEAGRQVYVVCPRIGGDEAEQGQVDQRDYDEDGQEIEAPPRTLAAVEEVAPELAAGPLAGLRIGTLHGRLASEQKDQVMRDFVAGDLDVLVSTTVIEVGVDVGNATVMVLLDADRFGVSQLHQLRGRVGRGGHPGLCLLVTAAEPVDASGEPTAAMTRLQAVAQSSDGFELARVDLSQRAEGDVLGRSQSGYHSGLRNLRVLRDEATIVAARQEAEQLLAQDPQLRSVPLLAAQVEALERSVHSDFMDKS